MINNHNSKEIPTNVQLKKSISSSLRLLKIVWSTDRYLLLISFASTIIPAVIPFINAYIYKLIIDFVIEYSSKNQTTLTPLLLLLTFRAFTYFIQDASFKAQNYATQILWLKVPIKINQLLLKKISNLDIQYFENSDFKNLLEKVRDSYSYRPQNVIDNILYGTQSFIQVIIALIALINLNFVLIIIVLFIGIIQFILENRQSKFSWAIWGWNSPLRKRFWYLTDLLQEASSLKEIKIFKLANKFLSDIKSIQEKFYKDNSKLAKNNFFLDISFNAISTIIFVGVEIYVIIQVLYKQLTIGDISFYTGVVSNFQNGLGGLLSNANKWFESSLYIQSLFEILDTKPIITAIDNPKLINHKTPPLIEFKNVSFTYPGNSKKTLDNFSLKIYPNEKIAFVGENGAGKSTIIKLMVRFYDVNQGEILINGINIKELNLDEYYKHIGILFQDFNKYEDYVKENIHYGKIESTLNFESVKKAAIESGADIIINNLDKGYEQMLGKTFEDGIELSTGQWQKIALARAFFRNANVLILDEPTSSIDAKAEAEIFAKVNELSKNKSLIIISHRFSTVRNADRIIVLKNGGIIEEGNHKELLNKNGLYSELFNIQAKGYK